jgi:hypothetical protein
MEKKNHIPQNSRDIAAVKCLIQLPFEFVKDDVPVLLEWIKDTHWEVAPGIARYLIPHVNEIAQDLLFILESEDSMWKYFVIYILIGRSKYKLVPELIKALKRIAAYPTEIDAEDSVDEAAKDVLANKFLCS